MKLKKLVSFLKGLILSQQQQYVVFHMALAQIILKKGFQMSISESGRTVYRKEHLVFEIDDTKGTFTLYDLDRKFGFLTLADQPSLNNKNHVACVLRGLSDDKVFLSKGKYVTEYTAKDSKAIRSLKHLKNEIYIFLKDYESWVNLCD
jgi:hypothetical protein